MSEKLSKHLRVTFLAGAVALLPVVALCVSIWYAETQTRAVTTAVLGVQVPMLGLVVALVAVYAVGLGVRSMLGRWFIRRADRLLERVPVFKILYRAWKQISFTEDGGEGVYSTVVMIPDAGGQTQILGFSAGTPVPGESGLVCVFVPNVPNPLTGRLVFVEPEKVRRTSLDAESFFKLLVSSGNYCPPVRLT